MICIPKEHLDRFLEGTAMARIPQHELNRLKKGIDLVDVVRASGVKLTG